MATSDDLLLIAGKLEGTTTAPHFDRLAFKVRRIYATLSADKASLNLKFTPEEQTLKCMTHPDAFAQIPNNWGRQGWTVARLAALSFDELEAAVQLAWSHALPKNKSGGSKS